MQLRKNLLRFSDGRRVDVWTVMYFPYPFGTQIIPLSDIDA